MNKQTAVEWLIDEIRLAIKNEDLNAIKISKLKMQAKAMEREQIEQAYIQGCWDEIDERMESCVEESCKRYYDETYKGGEQ